MASSSRAKHRRNKSEEGKSTVATKKSGQRLRTISKKKSGERVRAVGAKTDEQPVPTIVKLTRFLFPYGVLQVLGQVLGLFLIGMSVYSMANGIEIFSGNPIFTIAVHSITQTETSTMSTEATQSATSVSALSCSTHPCTLTVMISDTLTLNPYLAGKVSTVQLQSYNFAADAFVLVCGLFLLFLPWTDLPKHLPELVPSVGKTLRPIWSQLAILILSAFLGAELDKLIPLQNWLTHLMTIGVIIVLVIFVLRVAARRHRRS